MKPQKPILRLTLKPQQKPLLQVTPNKVMNPRFINPQTVAQNPVKNALNRAKMS